MHPCMCGVAHNGHHPSYISLACKHLQTGLEYNLFSLMLRNSTAGCSDVIKHVPVRDVGWEHLIYGGTGISFDIARK